jgi:hypothetical protein
MFEANEKFSTPADVRQKIDLSIIRYNGKAYYARHNGESNLITLYRVEKKAATQEEIVAKSKKVSYTDKNLDYSSPPLGFMNSNENMCIFLSRIPSRRFSSGLVNQSLEGTSLNGQKCSLPFEFPWSDELRKTIEEEYDSALTILKAHNQMKEAWSQAFARNLAFGFTKTNGLRLFHKHIPIAMYNEKHGGFQPTKSNNFIVDSILHNYGIKSYVA